MEVGRDEMLENICREASGLEIEVCVLSESSR